MMKKRLLALLLAASLLCMAVACGKTDEQSKDKDENNVEAEVNTEIKGTVTVGINSYRNSDFSALCEAFEKQYPNVKVEPILFESSTDDATEYLTSVKMAEQTMEEIYQTVKEHFVHPIQEQ